MRDKKEERRCIISRRSLDKSGVKERSPAVRYRPLDSYKPWEWERAPYSIQDSLREEYFTILNPGLNPGLNPK